MHALFVHTFGVTSGVGVGVGVGVGCGCGTGWGWEIGVGVGVAFTVRTVTPLFQISFFPDFMQVNVFPLLICFAPAFKHFEPGVTAPLAKGNATTTKDNNKRIEIPNLLTS